MTDFEIDFTLPGGYVARHEGGLLWLVPQSVDTGRAPCHYGFAPPRHSSGSLEADANAALAETVAAGMPRISNEQIALYGIAADGWTYYLSGGHFQAHVAGSPADLALMAMVMSAPANRVNVMFGLGKPFECTFNNDVAFAQLFHSLRPRGWPAPAGNAIERDLIGTWEGSMLSQHTFLANGGYSSGAAGQRGDYLISHEASGRYTLCGSQVTLTRGSAASERCHVQMYDKWNTTRWERAITVLYDDAAPPYVAEYLRRTP